MKRSKIKRLQKGFYYSPDTNKWIAKVEGEIENYWNIWNDENVTEEFAIGFNTLNDAVEFLQDWKNCQYVDKMIMSSSLDQTIK